MEQDVSLKDKHSLGFELRAAYYVELSAPSDLDGLRACLGRNRMPWLVLGSGTNVFFAKDYEGLVLRASFGAKQWVAEDEAANYVSVEAAEDWSAFVAWSLSQGYAGLENLSLIPGSVGAAPVQNIGAYGRSLSDYLLHLDAYDLKEGVFHRFSAEACQLGYRSSYFQSVPDRWVICSLTFRLPKRWTPCLAYPGVRAGCEALGVPFAALTPEQVADVIMDLRRSKLPDPSILPNAGSFFKNPVVSIKTYARLQTHHPELQAHETPAGMKLSAAQLIEACGWKGYARDGIGVYERHALVLVHRGGGTPQAFERLILAIQQSVKQRFKLMLCCEPRRV